MPQLGGYKRNSHLFKYIFTIFNLFSFKWINVQKSMAHKKLQSYTLKNVLLSVGMLNYLFLHRLHVYFHRKYCVWENRNCSCSGFFLALHSPTKCGYSNRLSSCCTLTSSVATIFIQLHIFFETIYKLLFMDSILYFYSIIFRINFIFYIFMWF